MYVDAGIYVEESCYDCGHIKNVLKEIKKNFEGYFQRFLESNAGNGLYSRAVKFAWLSYTVPLISAII